MKRLIIAYGNRDREDDGAGWHILEKVASKYDLNVPELAGEWVDTTDGKMRLLYLFQLLPEMAEDICEYDHVIFIDAHNSEQLPNLVFEEVGPTTEHSAFTHHMSAGELLAIAKTITGAMPKAELLTVRGFSFQFKQDLSEQTAQLVEEASGLLLERLEEPTNQQTPYVDMPLATYLAATDALAERTKPVIREHSLELIVNGESWLTFICSPIEIEQLAVGFLWNQHAISGKEAIEKIEIAPDLSTISVKLPDSAEKPANFQRTSTGVEPVFTSAKMASFLPAKFPAKDLIALYNQFKQKQTLHDHAGGFHTAGISDGQQINLIMEDVGRHNCVDKLAGGWLLCGRKFKPEILMLTGRVSSEMVMKSLALGVRFIVSRTTPTNRAVEIAEKAGICLVGYMRTNQFEVYTHNEYLGLATA